MRPTSTSKVLFLLAIFCCVDRATRLHSVYFQKASDNLLLLDDGTVPGLDVHDDNDRIATWKESLLKETSDVNIRVDETLSFLPWEVESAVNRTCHLPSDMPIYCCVGTESLGGKLKFKEDGCVIGMRPYDKVKKQSLQFLQQHPISLSMGDEHQGPSVMCDACHIVDQLARHNMTLAFQGDSMTRQSFAGFECELRRRGYNVTNKEIIVKKKDERWNYGLGALFEVEVHGVLPDGPPVILRYYGMYRPTEDMVEIAEIFRNNDIVVVDHGLHYKPKQGEKFVEMMSSLVRTAHELQIRNDSRFKLLAWRETPAQHFFTKGGDYEDKEQAKKGCSPMGQNSEGFRTPLLRNAWEGTNFSMSTTTDADFFQPDKNRYGLELVRIPFDAFTRPFHELHPSIMDCTHFCSTPYLWLPIWRSLRMAMHRARTSFSG